MRLKTEMEDKKMLQYNNLFTPIKIGKLEIKNRFAMAPMGPLGLADAEGGFNQRGIVLIIIRLIGKQRLDLKNYKRMVRIWH